MLLFFLSILILKFAAVTKLANVTDLKSVGVNLLTGSNPVSGIRILNLRSDFLKKGIDISSYQGKIDFKKVKNAGYDFVIIKAGQGLKEMGTFKTLEGYQYVQNAEKAGLDWGAYWWSDAINANGAKNEAQKFLESLNGLTPTYPIFIDQEYNSPPANLGMGADAVQLRTDIIKAFLSVIESAGYYPGVYSSADWLNNWVDVSQLGKYDKWVAKYLSDATQPPVKNVFPDDFTIWQYTVIGKYGKKGTSYWTYGEIPGIAANCDVNVAYVDYPQIIKSKGLNGWNNNSEISTTDYKILYEKSQEKLNKILEIINNN